MGIHAGFQGILLRILHLCLSNSAKKIQYKMAGNLNPGHFISTLHLDSRGGNGIDLILGIQETKPSRQSHELGNKVTNSGDDNCAD